MSELEIIWTKVDEAPALATYSLLPIVQSFVGMAGVKMTLKDISLTGRILANFPEKLKPEQRVNDELAVGNPQVFNFQHASSTPSLPR